MTFVSAHYAPRKRANNKSVITVSIPSPFVPDIRFGAVQRFETHADALIHRGEQKIYEFQAKMGSLLVVLSGPDVLELDLLLLAKNTRSKVGTAPPVEPITQASPGRQEKSIQIDGLGSGTYYLVVQKNSPGRYPTKYDLAIGMREHNRKIEREPNNTPRESDLLDGGGRISLVGARHLQGQISSVNDKIDYWRFHLDKPSTLESYLEIERGVAVVDLLDAHHNLLKQARTAYPSGKAGLQCDRIPAGTYYARIRPIGPVTTRYRLRLEGHPVYGGNLSVQMHRITAIDDFERIGQRQADFYYRLTIDGAEQVSPVFENKDDVTFPSGGIGVRQFTRRVNINKRIIPIAIALFEQDSRKTTTADISPNANQRELQFTYDTLTGEVSGKGLTVSKERQHITVQGNQKPRARVTFEVNYETLTTGEVKL